ncbi:hypothetical protein EDB19DRAFT_1911772 [Suillus lakei]|nr:hypothetical protein EDB19DRAFT_1911772 [Suillus lakei]
MVHTKHTTKKSNGGSVSYIILNFSRATSTSGVDHQRRKALTASKATTVGGRDVEKRNAYHKAPTATKATLPMGDGHNEFCILCRDGAEFYEDNTLFMCSLCPRVVCRLCLQLLPDLETTVLQEDISFRCVCCYIKMNQAGAYFGFYKTNGVLVLDRFLPINGALEVSDLLEFAHSFLKPYYSGDDIRYLDVYYNIGTDEKLTPYHTQVHKMIKGLKHLFIWEHVVISVSTHTDEDFRDPFIGYKDDDTKEYHSTGVNDFLEIILQPRQSIIDHTQESYLWMLCCDTLVNNVDSFHGLQEAVVQ